MTVRELIVELMRNYPMDAKVSTRGFNESGDGFDVDIVNVFGLYNQDSEFVGVCLTNDPDED